MLPSDYRLGAVISLLLVYLSNSFVAANSQPTVWNDYPLNCYTCDIAEECSQGLGAIRKCEQNEKQDCVTVFSKDGSSVQRRGCSDKIAQSLSNFCNQNPDKCPSCSSNGCNEATSLHDYVECVSCDSANNNDCVLYPFAIKSSRLCLGHCMVALYRSKSSENGESYQLVRSCVDDKDPDEREACISGSDANCVACKGKNCNTLNLPEKRFSCHHCAGDECNTPMQRDCVVHNAQDQCYILFEVETNNKVRQMGCRSDFNDSLDVIGLLKQKQVYFCDGPNCNNLYNLPTPNVCTKCDSRTERDCAVKPMEMLTSVTCDVKPYTQCFETVTEDGATVRGCLSDLVGDEFYNCLNNNTETCRTCVGDTCNIQTHRKICHRCNSKNDPNCETKPNALSVCPTYKKSDGCVAIFENNVTHRGCASELTCDIANTKTCQICADDGCNSRNLKKNTEEVYGIFQQLPLNCYTCNGSTECAGNKGVIRKCENNIRQDCTTVFATNGSVIQRGCEDVVQQQQLSHCETFSQLCFNCKSNGCNTIARAEDFVECIYCDTTIDPLCVHNPSAVQTKRKCHKGCVTALHERKSSNNVYDVVRTCLEDIEDDDRDKCHTGSKNCDLCMNSNCNKIALPDKRLKCMHCEGVNCENPIAKECATYSETDQCFMQFDNATRNVIRLGCKSVLTTDEVNKLLKELFLCNGDNCNGFDNMPQPNVCTHCDSTTNTDCAVNPGNVADKIKCELLPHTDCYSKIESDGHTVRGCSHSLELASFTECYNGNSSTCNTCRGNNCNAKIFPENRQLCFRCNSAEDPDCETTPKVSQACPFYHENDACVTKLFNHIIYRGCSSEIPCNSAKSKACSTCEGNNCNNGGTAELIDEFVGNPGQFQDLPLNCYHCKGRECMLPTVGTLRKCESNNLQTCTVVFDAKGKVTSRGCRDAVESDCQQSSNKCYDCKSNGCNIANNQSDYIDCLFCDAKYMETCTYAAEDITRTRECYKSCMTALYANSSDLNSVYVLTRTCLDDMELDDRETCEKGNNPYCKACSTAKCNRDSVPEDGRKSCYHCVGDSCRKPIARQCGNFMENDQCFVQYSETNDIVEMGCTSKHDPDQISQLFKKKRLYLCDQDNCNQLKNLAKPQHCALCNSLTDRLCATQPSNVNTSTPCDNLPYPHCYSRVLSNGHTERGCLSDLDDVQFLDCLHNTNNTLCQSCMGENCNKEVFPKNRTTCHICNSQNDNGCESLPQNSSICLKYRQNHKCVSTLLISGATQRGCNSELTCNPRDSATCQFCSGNDCNNLNLKRKFDGEPGVWQDLPLNCYTCSDQEECKNSKVRRCTGNENQYCMTIFADNGEALARGCSDEIEQNFGAYCDDKTNHCINCNSNGCNSDARLTDYTECVYCNSKSNPECVSDVTAIGMRRLCKNGCMTALHPRNYTGYTKFDLSRSCLDDKDIDDQTVCQSGSNKNCVACTGKTCNTVALPEDRLSCWQCIGAQCRDPVNRHCSAYTKNDRCFMLFDYSNNMVQMGCTSDVNKDFLAQNRQKMYICNGANCNGYEYLPKPQSCTRCNSINDTRCATNPSEVPDIVECAALPYTDCSTRIKDDGSTERGCVSDMHVSEMFSCLSGNATDCKTCNGNGCNSEIFPRNRRKCHRCNSLEDPTCESEPSAGEICPFYSTEEKCTVKLVNGTTYRGCSSDIAQDCNNFDDMQNCRDCKNSDNCNDIDLAALHIGYPGKWQDVPINCYTCYNADCSTGSGLGVVRKCEKNKLQNCGIVFLKSGIVAQRGCSDEINKSSYKRYCINNPEMCKFCNSNGCNTAKQISDYTECIFCDSAVNPNCVRNVGAASATTTKTRHCHGKCLTALYSRSSSFAQESTYDLLRSCLNDMDLDDQEACESGDKKYCEVCEGASCNTMALPEKRHKCFTCEGDNCENASSMECLRFIEKDQCYTLFENRTNNIIRMGCRSDLDAEFIETNRKKLLFCGDVNCNELGNLPPATRCIVCGSDKNENCATRPNTLINSEMCTALPYTSCFTRVTRDGFTERGCLSQLDGDSMDECLNPTTNGTKLCKVCSKDYCNDEIYPENRRSCHRCNSTVAGCENSHQNSGSICPIYRDNDSCASKIDGDLLYHGCTSDFVCNTADPQTCRVCNSTDNCNVINLLASAIGYPGRWQNLPLNCYQCDGTAACTKSSGTLRKCENNNIQNCMTVFNASGEVVQRGCSDYISTSQADYCEAYPEMCIGCKSSGCNNAKSLNEFVDCYFCDSSTNGHCVANYTGRRTRKCHGNCMVALYPKFDEIEQSYDLSRSCADDKEFDDREFCESGKDKHCKVCQGSRCNIASLPETRLECYKCIGEECEDPVKQMCSSYHENDQCYILFKENELIQMGCRSEFSMESVTSLVKSKQMLICDGKNCNHLDLIPQTKVCTVCNSEEDPRCATSPGLIENAMRCSSQPYTDCVIRINDDGYTERGCLALLEDDIFYKCLTKKDGKCHTCSDDRCNIDVYPVNRMICHHCNSTSDQKCSVAPNSNSVCPLYKENDSCVSHLRNGITYRGCSSGLKCDRNSKSCRVCKTPGCNTYNFEKVSPHGDPGRWQELPLNCYTCKGVENCSKSLGVVRKCESSIWENCMTVFNKAGNVVERGCIDTVEETNRAYCDSATGKCPRCNSNGCNIARSLDDYVECLSCDSADESNGKCLHDAAAGGNTRWCHKSCMTALYPRSDEGNPAYELARTCLDDKDIDDRESCQTGNEEFCKACSGAKCNTVSMPEKRHSCYSCKGDECQSPSAKTCVTYRPNDKCFIQFDETMTAIEYGCRSAFTNADADFLMQTKRLFVCEGDDCNKVDAPPPATKCALCNSRTDSSCAQNPSQVMSMATCDKIPYTHCYSRVLPDGATERGCLSNLFDDEFMGCLNGTSATCTTCLGDSCNKKIFPENRLSCHLCDSKSDLMCEKYPNRLSICRKFANNDTCVTSLSDGVTYRDCGSSLKCDSANSHLCRTCIGTGCNTVNLAEKSDDEFGKWQDLPLSCYTCEGESSCQTLPKEKIKCENNNKQDCMVVFNRAGKVVHRGCSDAVEAQHYSYCKANDDRCYNCKSNGCNTAKDLTEFNDCIYCDSSKNTSCVTASLFGGNSSRKCQGGCMVALYPSDMSDNPSYELIRTCLSDKDLADQKKCKLGKDTMCKACTNENNCNTYSLPEKRLKCHTCVGATCENPVLQACTLFKEDDKCFTWFDGNNDVTEMGCISSMRNQSLEALVKTKRIFLCDSGDGCNDLSALPAVQQCAVCNSRSNVQCATNALEIGTFSTCNQFPYTHCYSKIEHDGTTSRGCLTDLAVDKFAACLLNNDSKCKPCVGNGCNREIFPEDRLQCYKCNTNEDPECESFPSETAVCPYVRDSEHCVTSLSGNMTERDCSSQLHCDETDKRTCRHCSGTGCNTIDLKNKHDDGNNGVWQDLPLKCHTCSGELCTFSLGPALHCTDDDVFQDCMTVFDEAGEVRRRGCSNDVEDYEDLYCRKNPSRCFHCKSNECNMAWNTTEYIDCSYCNSSTNPLCTTDPEQGSFNSRKCYKSCMVAMHQSNIIRSCLDDKELIVQNLCKASASSGSDCAACDSDNCNKFVYPADRLKCYMCTGFSCNNATAQYCSKYMSDDFCFAKYENGHVNVMGCGSSVNANEITQWTNQNKLFRCNGSECNEPSNLPNTMMCVSCNSSLSDSCAISPSSVLTTEMCAAPISHCVTRIDQGGVTLRGCLRELPIMEQNSCDGPSTTLCTKCIGDRCNTDIYPSDRRLCHICSSLTNPTCITAPNQLSVCPTYVSNDTCIIKVTNDLTERGCSADLSCDAENNANHCAVCNTDGCNTADLTAGAAFTTASVMMVLAIVAIVFGSY